mgnify:CR=1 FL=1
MLSVKDITRAQVDALIERVDGARGPIAVAVTNSATHYVLSGYPEDLAAFGVKVAKVNTINMQGKMKRMGARPAGRRPSWKKAMVTLTADSKTIEFFEGMV